MSTHTGRISIYFLLAVATCLGSPKTDAWKVLNKGLTDEDTTNRAEAVAALGSIGPDSGAVRLAEKALDDKSPAVRRAAAAALGESRSLQSIPHLKKALSDRDERVTLEAAKALADMGDTSGDFVFQRLLTGQMKDNSGLVHDAMHDARGKMHDPGTIALFGISQASVASPFIGGPANVGVWLIRRAVKDKGVPGRIMAVDYLVRDPSAYAETLLEWGLNDSSWAVRATVVKGLGDRGNPIAIEKLQPLLTDGHRLVSYLAAATIVRLSNVQEAAASHPQLPPSPSPPACLTCTASE